MRYPIISSYATWEGVNDLYVFRIFPRLWYTESVVNDKDFRFNHLLFGIVL